MTEGPKQDTKRIELSHVPINRPPASSGERKREGGAQKTSQKRSGKPSQTGNRQRRPQDPGVKKKEQVGSQTRRIERIPEERIRRTGVSDDTRRGGEGSRSGAAVKAGARKPERRNTLTAQRRPAPEGARRPRKKTRKKRYRHLPLVILGVVLGLFFCVCLIISGTYGSSHFLRGTMINEIDASGMTLTELEGRMRQYRLVMKERTKDGEQTTDLITGDAIGVKVADLARVEEIIEKQNVWSIFSQMIFGKEKVYQIDNLYGYDANALAAALKKARCFQEDFVDPPKDAGLSDYDPLQGFVIVPEQQGNQLDYEKALGVVTAAVDALEPEVDLDEAGCYLAPKIYRDNPVLRKLEESSQKYAKIHITYTFGEEKEIIDGNVLCDWLDMNYDTGDVTVDQAKVDEFVLGLKKKYDTIFGKRNFKTSYGKEVVVSGGDYGWWMDYKTEQKELYDMIRKGESGERTPVYFQTAAAYGDHDWGDSYVEANLTAQHLFVYKDGMRVLDSDFVSGNESRGFSTPEGTYSMTYKERNAMLVGENYETPVSYWMPFNQNIGLHDAVWRSDFGGSIYKTSGSHGCLNLPYAVAKQIYSYAEKGMPVICYHLDGTQSDMTTPQGPAQQAQTVIDAINNIGEVKKDSGKKIERARQLYREASEEARGCVSNLSTLEAAEAAFAALQ